MIVDTSALLAILFDEPDAERFRIAIVDNTPRLMSVANYVEAGARLARDTNSNVPLKQLQALIAAIQLKLEPVSVEQGQIAIEAYRSFGKGSGSQARLNYGDCFAYAPARHTGYPLLFKGLDFSHTDIASVL